MQSTKQGAKPARIVATLRHAGLLAAVLVAGLAHAADFPTKPIKLVVPFSPGGSTDVIARMVAKEMSTELGQPIVVENRDGASGAIATTFVARAPADGYTLCYCTTGSLAILPLYETLSYKPERDLAPVTLAINQPFVLVVRTSLGVHNFAEFIALAKANPGKFSFGSPGTATPSHLSGELLKIATGIDIRHIPYRGDTPAVQDMLGGHIDAMMLSAVSVKALLDTGKITALGASSINRIPSMPTLPTIAELGYRGFQTNNLQAVVAPAGTPADVIARLNAAAVSALKKSEVRSKLEEQGLIVVADSPESAARTFKDETARWAPVVEKLQLKQQ